jgi:hypothetical protein
MNDQSKAQKDTKPAGSRSWLEIIATWTAIAGALFGGIFGLYQFVGNLKASRAKEALAYVERFSEAPVAPSYTHFEQYFSEFRSKHTAQELNDPQVMINVVSERAIEDDVIVVIHFFDNVAVCTCKQLCDEQLVTLFLRSQARDFFDITSQYIENAQKTSGTAGSQGAGLKALALTSSKSDSRIDCSFVVNSII